MNIAGLLVLIGVLAGVGQLLMTYSYKHLPVASGSLFGLLVPVLNVLVGMLYFSESLSLVNGIGMLVVVVCCGLIVLDQEGR